MRCVFLFLLSLRMIFYKLLHYLRCVNAYTHIVLSKIQHKNIHMLTLICSHNINTSDISLFWFIFCFFYFFLLYERMSEWVYHHLLVFQLWSWIFFLLLFLFLYIFGFVSLSLNQNNTTTTTMTRTITNNKNQNCALYIRFFVADILNDCCCYYCCCYHCWTKASASASASASTSSIVFVIVLIAFIISFITFIIIIILRLVKV